MGHTTLSIAPREGTDPESIPISSLYEVLQALPDGRRSQGKRYSLALVLCCVVLAKLAGEKTMSGATDWIRHRGPSLAQRFGLRRAAMPCQTTYSNVLALVDVERLDELLGAFFVRWEAQNRCKDEPSRLQMPQGQADHRHLAIDGKTIRATTAQAHPVHQLSCYEVATGIVLWHCNVQEKENEISALKPLLTTECVTGRILTLDAMHTQRELCAQVHRLGGDDILIAKDNQPTLREDIADVLEDRRPDRRRRPQAETWNKGHGRLEHRQIVCSPDRNRLVRQDMAGDKASCFGSNAPRACSNQARGGMKWCMGSAVSRCTTLHLQPCSPSFKITGSSKTDSDFWRDVSLGEDACQTRVFTCARSARSTQ